MHDGALCVLALDVGGTHIRAAIVDETGRIRKQRREAANLSRLPEDASANETVVNILSARIQSMLDACRTETGNRIRAIGLGFPGFIHRGIVRASPNIRGLADLSLAAELEHRLGLPVRMENDAALAALGESRFGAGAPMADLIHLTLGTGVGGGLVLNGALYTGVGGMAMEIGHLCVRPGGRTCGCGNQGCLEAYASARAVAERWRERSHDPEAREVDAREIHRLAAAGEPIACQILEEAGECLGLAIAQAVNLLDVRQVRIGGGMSGAWDQLQGSLHASLNAHLIPPLKHAVSVAPSRLGDDAAILGAASLALEGARYR